MKVCHISTSLATKGGISGLLLGIEHETGDLNHVPTHSDKSNIYSIFLYMVAFFKLRVGTYDFYIFHYGGEISAMRKYFLSMLIDKNKMVSYQHLALSEAKAEVGFWERRLIKRSAKVIVLGEAFKTRLKTFCDDINVLGNFGVPHAELRYKKNEIVFAGSFENRKGVLELAHAFKNINLNKYTLKLIGDGPCRDEIMKVVRCGNIEVYPWLSKSELHEHLASAKFFCLPSRAEGLSVAIIESLIYGCVPLITRVGCHAEYFTSSVRWIDKVNSEVIKKTIQNSVDDWKAEDVRKARDLYITKFSFESYWKKFNEILDVQ